MNTQHFHEIKPRKAKFAFKMLHLSGEEKILVAAEAIKMARWLDPECFFAHDTDNSNAIFTIYTNDENCAEKLRDAFVFVPKG